MENRAAHLLGEEKIKGTEIRTEDAKKIAWSESIWTTVKDAQVRLRGSNNTVYYIRSYKEGIHMVVTADGVIQNHHALISQFSPDIAKYRFGDDTVVEKSK